MRNSLQLGAPHSSEGWPDISSGVEINPKSRSVPTRKANKYVPKCSLLLVFFSNLPEKKLLKAKVFIGYSNRFVVFILFVCDSFGLASLTALVPCVLVLNDPASFCVRHLALEQVRAADGSSTI